MMVCRGKIKDKGTKVANRATLFIEYKSIYVNINETDVTVRWNSLKVITSVVDDHFNVLILIYLFLIAI